MTKPIASLSLDLDNKWSYLKTHGDPGWESFPSYLNLLAPRILGTLKARNLTCTVFIVGQDAALQKNRESLAAIAAAGHEIGNHSFSHEPWMHLYSRAEVEDDIARAEAHIGEATGRKPLGFRGPGFSTSASCLQTLARRGYVYDASSFPTFLGPLARTYYLMTARLSREERSRRRALFGTFRDGLRPLHPHLWETGAGQLLEIPVATVPLLRLPFHLSYILYLCTFSQALALRYFRTALWLCRWTGTQPSLLLHPLDFLGSDDTSDLSFFPGMSLPRAKKLELLSLILGILSSHFQIVSLREHAREVLRGTPRLPVRPPALIPKAHGMQRPVSGR